MAGETDDIFNDTDGLVGSQCEDCGELFFPQVGACGNCASQSLRRIALGKTGTLWSWTVQWFKPKPPFLFDETQGSFVPYGVGLVQMECGLIVKSRLHAEPLVFSIGMPMFMNVVTYARDENGERKTYEFRPGDPQ